MYQIPRDVAEPSVSITLVLPAKNVPEALGKLPENIRVHVTDVTKLNPSPLYPCSPPMDLDQLGITPEKLEEMRDLARRQTEATERIASKK